MDREKELKMLLACSKGEEYNKALKELMELKKPKPVVEKTEEQKVIDQQKEADKIKEFVEYMKPFMESPSIKPLVEDFVKTRVEDDHQKWTVKGLEIGQKVSAMGCCYRGIACIVQYLKYSREREREIAT